MNVGHRTSMNFSPIVCVLLLLSWTAGQELDSKSEPQTDSSETSRDHQIVGFEAQDVLHLGLKRCRDIDCCPLRLNCCRQHNCCNGRFYAGSRLKCWNWTMDRFTYSMDDVSLELFNLRYLSLEYVFVYFCY